MQRIPDHSRRATYNIYVREGFKSKGHLVPHSREATTAIEDAMEQLESMNYYHSIRNEKEGLEFANPPLSRPTLRFLSDFNTCNMTSEKSIVVEKWLREALPQLHVDDVSTYTAALVDDGFDSEQVLESELLLEDLDFMKKAHRRALIRSKNLEK